MGKLVVTFTDGFNDEGDQIVSIDMDFDPPIPTEGIDGLTYAQEYGLAMLDRAARSLGYEDGDMRLVNAE